MRFFIKKKGTWTFTQKKTYTVSSDLLKRDLRPSFFNHFCNLLWGRRIKKRWPLQRTKLPKLCQKGQQRQIYRWLRRTFLSPQVTKWINHLSSYKWVRFTCQAGKSRAGLAVSSRSPLQHTVRNPTGSKSREEAACERHRLVFHSTEFSATPATAPLLHNLFP